MTQLISPKVNCVNPIFKCISEALFMTKKHEKVIRKILAAHLKTNWKRLNPHWTFSGGNKLASHFCELISSGHCDYELAAFVASDLFGRKVVSVQEDSRECEIYGESVIVNPIYIPASKIENWKNAPNSVEQAVPIDLGKQLYERFKSVVRGKSGKFDSNMATGEHSNHMASSTGSTRTACKGAFDEATNMTAPKADDAQRDPPSDARLLTPAKATKTNSGEWSSASAEICCTYQTTACKNATPNTIQDDLHSYWKENFDISIIEGNPDDPSPSRSARKDWWPGGGRRKVFGAPPHLCSGDAFNATLEALVHHSRYTRDEESTPWRRPSDSDSQGEQNEGHCEQRFVPSNGNGLTTAALQNRTLASEEILCEKTDLLSDDMLDRCNSKLQIDSSANIPILYHGFCKCGEVLVRETWIYPNLTFQQGVQKAKELLGKIFELNKSYSWDDNWAWKLSEGKYSDWPTILYFDWHTLHMLDFNFWGNKSLIELIPNVLEGRTKSIKRCSKRFEKHKEKIIDQQEILNQRKRKIIGS